MYFKTEDGYGYARERFSEMSGIGENDNGYAEGLAAYDKIKSQINMRAVTRDFGACADGGMIELDGAFIKCEILKNIRGIKKIYAYALTSGELSLNGTTLERTLEDIWGTAFVDSGIKLLRDKIIADNPHMHVSHPFGPGFYGIKINEIATLFNALDCRDVGIELKDGLLSPMKSSIGFFVVSDRKINLPSKDCISCAGDASCEYCGSNARVTVTFANENKKAIVPAGITVTEAAKIAGVIIETPCGGMGVCGKCAGETEQNGDTKTARLCAERVYNDMTVYTKRGDTKISIDVLTGERYGEYSLAVDIGTTTIEAELIGDTKTIARAFAVNPQTAYCADVIGRIRFAEKDDALHRLIINEINRVINKICEAVNISSEQITSCAFSGNTAMQYIAAGKNPRDLGRYPYTVTEAFGTEVKAAELGIDISENGRAYFPPIISAFIGGDIASGIICARLWEKNNTLFIDIGTNGEMITANEGRLIAASTAAGPAFEGAGITFGMRAESGAIERFKILNRNTVMVETINKAPALGICGSGLIDIVGELVKNGIITGDGSFSDKRSITSPVRNRLCEYKGEAAFKICGEIYLTQSDVRQVQLAKAAIRAGIEVLAENAEGIIIAGAFGRHTSIESLINVGIIPKRFFNAAKFMGNTSLEGAKLLLNDADLRKKISELAANAETVLLSDNEKFESSFIKYMNFGE